MSEHVFTETDGGLKFVGDFDALYREEDDPWGQSATDGQTMEYYFSSRSTLHQSLRSHFPFGKYYALEVGCGHGHAVNYFDGNWTGMDISPTAINKARELYKIRDFFVGDIREKTCMPEDHAGFYNVVLLSQMLWYILERIDDAVSNALSLCAADGLLIVSQAFLKDEQRYGVDIANGFPGALHLFSTRFPSLELVEARFDTSTHSHNDGLMIFRKPA
jgi:SAM-dependent methyltransferase